MLTVWKPPVSTTAFLDELLLEFDEPFLELEEEEPEEEEEELGVAPVASRGLLADILANPDHVT